MTTQWHGIYGSYPVPERFAHLMNGSISLKRQQALKDLGEFYHWAHAQECKEAAKLSAMNRRRAARKNVAPPLIPN